MGNSGTLAKTADELDSREDSELVLAVHNGDSAAFAVLYRRYVRGAYRAAARWSAGPAERDDIVSESFGRLLATLRNGGGPRGEFFPYLLRVIHNIAVDHARQGRLVEPCENLDLLEDPTPPVDPVVQEWQHKILAIAFASLSPRWQEALHYLEIEGLRPAAAAAQLGLSANAMAALAYRARQGLRQAYLELSSTVNPRLATGTHRPRIFGGVRGASCGEGSRES